MAYTYIAWVLCLWVFIMVVGHHCNSCREPFFMVGTPSAWQVKQDVQSALDKLSAQSTDDFRDASVRYLPDHVWLPWLDHGLHDETQLGLSRHVYTLVPSSVNVLRLQIKTDALVKARVACQVYARRAIPPVVLELQLDMMVERDAATALLVGGQVIDVLPEDRMLTLPGYYNSASSFTSVS